jgi:hypothetical protein
MILSGLPAFFEPELGTLRSVPDAQRALSLSSNGALALEIPPYKLGAGQRPDLSSPSWPQLYKAAANNTASNKIEIRE